MKLERLIILLVILFTTFVVVFFVSSGNLNIDSYLGFFSRLLGNTIVIKNEKVRFNLNNSSEFTTKILNIKFDKQDYILSCEVATLKMALKYRGLNLTEDQLFSKLPTDKRPPEYEEDGTMRWGDPNLAFVGNRNGKMFIDGYGVHWEPIATLANTYRDSEFFRNWSIDDIIYQIDNDNPVIIWGYYGPGGKFKWYTWDGRRVDAVKFEHTYLVNGYEKKGDKLTAIFVIDPNRGKLRFSVDDFKNLWRFYENSGVVIY